MGERVYGLVWVHNCVHACTTQKSTPGVVPLYSSVLEDKNITCHHSRFWLNNVHTFRLLTSELSSVIFLGPSNEHEGTGFCLQIALCP